MSGGHFAYRHYQIRELAEEIDGLITGNGKKDEFGDVRYYSKEIIEKLKETTHALNKAADMFQRVDWLVSGDDGEESFLKRWKEDVDDVCPDKG
jgi:hypothetical protein